MRLFLCFIFASVMTVQAEIQRWPMRIIETTYTVNSLTGAKYNYKDKNKVSTVVVDVNLVNDNGEKVIRFKQRATSSMVETKSETAEGDVVVQDLPKMLDAVEKSVSEMSRISKQEDLEEVLFEGSSVKLTLCRHKRKFSFLYYDADLYEPCKVMLDLLHDKLSVGGVFVFDEYGLEEWPGETQAVDEFISANKDRFAVEKPAITTRPGMVLRKLKD